MESFAEVGVLAADGGHARGQFGVDKAPDERQRATGDPGGENQRGSVDELGDNVRIDKNAGADNAAHDDHGGVEKAETRGESFGRSGNGCNRRARVGGFLQGRSRLGGLSWHSAEGYEPKAGIYH